MAFHSKHSTVKTCKISSCTHFTLHTLLGCNQSSNMDSHIQHQFIKNSYMVVYTMSKTSRDVL